MSESEDGTFAGFAILELMGHRRLAGFVTETKLAGAGMLRIDIPDGPSQFYAPTALYALTPVSEETARAVAASFRPEPVTQWELPALRRPSLVPDDDDDDYEAER